MWKSLILFLSSLTLVVDITVGHQCVDNINLYNDMVYRAFENVTSTPLIRYLTITKNVSVGQADCSKPEEGGTQLEATITYSNPTILKDTNKCQFVAKDNCEVRCGVEINNLRVHVEIQGTAFDEVVSMKPYLQAVIYTERDTYGPTGEILDPWYILLLDSSLDRKDLVIGREKTHICLDFFRRDFIGQITNRENLTNIFNYYVETNGSVAKNTRCLSAIPRAVQTAKCVDRLDGGLYHLCAQNAISTQRLSWEQIFEHICNRSAKLEQLEKCNQKFLSVTTRGGTQTWDRVWTCSKGIEKLIG